MGDSDQVSVDVCSLPAPPLLHKVIDEEITEARAIVRWSVLGEECSSISHYLVSYTIINSNGTEAMPPGNTKQLQVEYGEESLVLQELKTGATYNVSVKIVLSDGKETPFSVSQIFSTKFDMEGIDGLAEEALAQLDALSQRIDATSIFCGYQDSWQIPYEGTISYDKLVYEERTPGLESASLDIQTGAFTVGQDGIYQISFSMKLQTEGGWDQSIWIRINGNLLVDVSEMMGSMSQYYYSFGEDTGSRSLMYKLSKGDKVELYRSSEGGSSSVLDVLFCVSNVNLV